MQGVHYTKQQISLASSTLTHAVHDIIRKIEFGRDRLVTTEDQYGNPLGALIHTPLSVTELNEIADALIKNEAHRKAIKKIIKEYSEGKIITEEYEDEAGNLYELEINITLENRAFKDYFISFLSQSLMLVGQNSATDMLNAAGVSKAIAERLRPPSNMNLKAMPGR